MAPAMPKKLYLICRSATKQASYAENFWQSPAYSSRYPWHGSFQPQVYKTLKAQWDISNCSVKGKLKKANLLLEQAQICYRELYFH